MGSGAAGQASSVFTRSGGRVESSVVWLSLAGATGRLVQSAGGRRDGSMSHKGRKKSSMIHRGRQEGSMTYGWVT